MNERLTESVMALQDSLGGCREAISGMGGLILGNEGFSQLPDAIRTIPFTENVYSQTDSATAQNKRVPNGSAGYCYLKSLGGMSHTDYQITKNLIPYPYVSVSGATVDSDGSLSFDFIDTAYVHIDFEPIYLKKDNIYNICVNSFFPDAVIEYNYGWETTDGNIIWQDCGSFIPENDTTIIGLTADFTNHEEHGGKITFNLIISEGETQQKYIPRFIGIKNTCVTEIKSKGANLVNHNQPFAVDKRTATGSGGYYPQLGWNVSDKIPITPSKSYSHNLNVNSYCAWFDKNGNYINGFTIEPNKAQYAPSTAYYIRMDYPQGVEVMLSQSSTTPTYKPYVGHIGTTCIPKEIQNCEGYGNGLAASVNNYIDFEEKVFVKNTKTIIFTGKEEWSLQSINQAGLANFSYSLGEDKAREMTVLCPYYKWDNNLIANAKDEGVFVNTTSAFIRSFKYKTLNAWLEHLEELNERGAPLMIEYALITPTKTPINIPDALIAVEGGGTLSFENENGFALPSTVHYEILNS